MTGRHGKWRFYGREKETALLARAFQGPAERLQPLRIHGRAGVGKSALVRQVAERCSGNPPVFAFELADGSPEDSLRRFAHEARKSLPQELVEGFTSREEMQDRHPSGLLAGLVSGLLVRGVTVALDEFHLARDGNRNHGLERILGVRPAGDEGLENAFADMIGRLRAPDTGPVKGRLVFLGSSRQRLHDMFRPGRPLGRCGAHGLVLEEWTPRVVFEMAEEQGLLGRPARFLTLWAAFGGMPGRWRDFVLGEANASLSDMTAWEDDDAWRLASLEDLAARLGPVSDERTDVSAIATLAPPQRDLFMHLARNAPDGTGRDELVQVMRDKGHGDVDEPLTLLERHLGLVETRDAFRAHASPRTWVSDSATLFHAAVHPETSGGATGEDIREARLRSLARIEGTALKRLALDHVAACEDVAWAETDAWRPAPGTDRGIVEADVLALCGQSAAIDPRCMAGRLLEPGAGFVMCACRRNASEHEVDPERPFTAFVDSVEASEEAAGKWPSAPLRRILVATAFTDEERTRFHAKGFETLDLTEMATRALSRPPVDPCSG